MFRMSLRGRMLAAALLATIGISAACSEDSNGPTTVATPTGLTAGQLSLTSVRVSWTAVAGATSYSLQRTSAASPGVFTDIGGSLTATTYDDVGLTAGVAYGYRVRASIGTATSAYSTVVNITTGLKQTTVNANIAANRTFYADTVYVLSGYVKVTNNSVLTIQPGTKIVGDSSVAGSSLWILRGSRIEANGTAAAPIVFTSQRSAGNRAPGDWGGIIIIGNATINRNVASILTEGPAGVGENYAAGNNDADNSGTLRYVRIEFAGYDVTGTGQELNSLSMYAVGRGTTLEFIQTMSGLDDSFEWWGGTVDARYLVSYEAGDDHFDWTEGYRGRIQYMIALQTQRLVPRPGTGFFSSDPRGFEGDGCDNALTGCTMTTTGTSTPYSFPVFANFTLIGPGNLASIPTDGNGGVWRRGTAGHFYNGIMARWKGTAIQVRDAWTDTLLQARDSLNIVAVLLAQNGFNYDSTTGTFFGHQTKFATNAHQTYAANVAVDTLLGINLNPTGLDWTPKATAPATAGGQSVPAPLVTAYFGGTWANTTYLGAAQNGGAKWWQGWTDYNIN